MTKDDKWDDASPVERLLILLRDNASTMPESHFEALTQMLVERLRERSASDEDVEEFLARVRKFRK